MTSLDSRIPLYNHPLPNIEMWLKSLGCKQNLKELNRWTLEKGNWQAEIVLEIEDLTVRYIQAGDNGKDVFRAFKYSLSRQDIEAAVLDGP
ncbi:MAG TPA: DUF3143 domain-containing protein [Allocoleopsis sp.]